MSPSRRIFNFKPGLGRRLAMLLAAGCALGGSAALAGTFPSGNLAFQTSGPLRAATIGDWYTTSTSSSTDRMHRFTIEITAAQLASAGGSITITVNDAESTGGPGPCDEVDGNACGSAAGTGDPTRFYLRSGDGSTILQGPVIFDTGSPNGSTASFTVTQAGTYQVTSEDGSTYIFGSALTNEDNDDNAFTITVPFSGGTNGGGLGSYQGSFQQDTGSSVTVQLYFVVGAGTTSLSLRNFDLDNGASSVTYTKPNGTVITGTISGNGVWNGAGGSLNAGADTVAVSPSDYGVWTYTINNFTTNNQTIFEADDQSGNRLPGFDTPPQNAGLFTMTPADVLQTTLGVAVDHPFTVTNKYFSPDVIEFSLSGTSANYTVQLLTSGGVALTDTDGDGKIDTGTLGAQQTGSFILRVTPNNSAATSDTTRVNGVSYLDTVVGTSSNTTVFIDKTTLLPPRITKSFSPNPVSPNTVTTLNFSLVNVNTYPLTAVQFTDALPTTPSPGMKVAATPAASTSNCGSPTWAPAANATNLSFSGASLAAGATCSVSVNVITSAVGSYNNTSGAITATAPVSSGTTTMTGNAANATLSVLATVPPSVAKAFSLSPIAVNGTSVLTLTVSNADTSVALAGVAVSDTYPAGMVNAATPAASTTCSGATLTGGTAGGSTIGITGGTLPVNSSCTISVTVTSASANTYNNVTGTVTSTNGGSGNSASASLVVEAPPTVAKSFTPAAINDNSPSVLTITLSNSNSVALSGAAFTDNYAAGMTNTGTPNPSTTCAGGTATAAAGGTSLALSGGTIPANGSCTVTVNVTRATAGSTNNTIAAGGLTTSGGISNTSASNTATLTATDIAPPTIAKSFSASPIANGSTSVLSLTISNPNPTATLNGVAVSDTYPANLVNANPASPAVSCSAGSTGNFTGGTNGGNTLGLTTADILPGGNCKVTVNVTSTTNATYTNTTGNVTSTNGGSGGTASANLVVQAGATALTLSKVFAPTSTGVGNVSVLSFTIHNTNNATENGIAFTDTFPTTPGAMILADTTTTNTCGGTLQDSGGGSLNAGDVGVQLSGGTLNANASCTISVHVSGPAAGTYNNTTTAITATGLPNGNTASASLTVVQPTLVKSFSPSSIGSGGTSVLTLVLGNTSSVDFTAASFTDVFPTTPGAMTLANTTVGNSCGGSLTNSGGGTLTTGDVGIRLSGGTIPANSTCNINVTVTATAGGTYANSIAAGGLSTSGGSNAAATSATLGVTAPPTIAKAFSPTTVQTNSNSTLTITLSNNNASAATSASFTDTLPSGVTTSGAATSNCAGAVVSQTSNSVSISGGTIPAGAPGSCTVTIGVLSSTPGTYTNTIAASALTASTGSNSSPATAVLTVVAPPTIAKAFTPASIGAGQTSNLTFTLTNPSGNGASLTGVAFSDTFPTTPGQMKVAATPSASTSGCGSPTFAPVANAVSISFSGGTIAVGATCTVSLTVTAPSGGSYNNTSGAVSASGPIALTGLTASATLTVGSPALVVAKIVSVLDDPINGSSSPKSIPSAEELYSIIVTNTGSGQVDNNSTIITDPLPANTVLFVGNLSGSSGLTVTFVDGSGSSASGLTALSAADISFSSQAGGGAPYTYTPTANSYDPNVTGIRINPKGILSGAGSGNPTFQLRFKVKLQ